MTLRHRYPGLHQKLMSLRHMYCILVHPGPMALMGSRRIAPGVVLISWRCPRCHFEFEEILDTSINTFNRKH